MPVHHGAPQGAPIWIDLTTSDPDRAQEFYGAVFGWTFDVRGTRIRRLRRHREGRPPGGRHDAQRPGLADDAV